MYFDAHSDIWTDVTVKREHGEKNVLKNHHLDRLRADAIRHLKETNGSFRF